MLTSSHDATTERLREAFLVTAEKAGEDPLAFLPPWSAELSPAERLKTPVICCGTGVMGWLFLQAARHLNVIGVVDDFKKGEDCHGFKCITTPEFIALAKRNPGAICVNTAQWDFGVRYFNGLARRFRLRVLNFGQAIRYLDCSAVDYRLSDWRPTIVSHVPELLELADSACDELSKQTLFSVLNFHLDTDREHLLRINRAYDAHYFRSGLFEARENEIFIDCGAAVGETVDHFLEITEERFDQIHAFEPDRENFIQLRAKVDRYRNQHFYDHIYLHNQAAGDTDGKVYFEDGSGEGSRIVDSPEGATEVDLVRMDNVLLDGATFMKIDVEGHEMSALRGAEQIIREDKPRIAVCVYHRDDDLLTIPAYLKSLNPDYRFGFRHCNQVRFDTVCFAF